MLTSLPLETRLLSAPGTFLFLFRGGGGAWVHALSSGSVGGAPGLTPSPRGAPSTLPPALWSSAGISQPFHCVHGFRCPFSQEGGQTALEHCEFSNTGAGLLQEDRWPLAAGPVRMLGPRRVGVSNRMPERTRQVTGRSGLGQVRGDREWRGLWGTGQRAPRGRGRGKLSSR